jgi:glycosyltransferase involved in cell wall biosynthesis
MTMSKATADAGQSKMPGSASPTARRISVALCTFNGARFLQPQLDSFPAQTRRPDELVVCDDGSTDDTLVILERFEKRAPFPVRIERNPTRLGSTKNFEKAIGQCTGDLIATCDQDDVWMPEKLALSEAAFEAEPARGLIFTDADVVDDELRSLGHKMWDAIHFGALARRRVRQGRWFEVLLRQWVVTGATMVFRSEYRPCILPIPESWVHDGWIAFIIGAIAPIGFVERSTIQYRQHAAQQIGGKKLNWRDLYEKAHELGRAHFRLEYERFQLARERLGSLSSQVRDPSILARVERKVAHQKRRLAIAESPSRWKRVLWTLDELLHRGYQRYSPATTHFIKDLLF